MTTESFFTEQELRNLRNIALDELRKLTSGLHPLLARMRKHSDGLKALKELSAIFHTIGGSAALVGFERIGDIGMEAESLLNNAATAGKISPEISESVNSLAKELLAMIKNMSETQT